MRYTLTETITEERSYEVEAPEGSNPETIRGIAYGKGVYTVESAEVQDVKIVDEDGHTVTDFDAMIADGDVEGVERTINEAMDS